MCVEAFDAYCSNRAAVAGAWLTRSRVSGAGASPRAAYLAAGRAHVHAVARPALLFACGDFLLEHGARDSSNPALTARTC